MPSSGIISLVPIFEIEGATEAYGRLDAVEEASSNLLGVEAYKQPC